MLHSRVASSAIETARAVSPLRRRDTVFSAAVGRRCMVGRVGVAATALTLLASTARAAESTPSERDAAAARRRRVVIVVSPTKPDGVALLRAELQALGLEVVEASPGEGPAASPSAPDSTTRDAEDFRIVLRSTQVEVWILDSDAGKVTLREVFAESDGTPLDMRTAVLHAVELLQWHLREREPQTRRSLPRDRSLPAPAASFPRAERRKEWLFSLVPQALYSPGGTTLGVGAEIDVALRWSHFAARLFASSVLLPNELFSSEGSAQVTSRFLGWEGVLLSSEGPMSSGLEASLGVGATLVSTELRASAASGYQAHDDHLLTAAPILDLRASYVVSDSVAIALCSSLMTPLRSSSLRFGDREAGRYGQFVATFGIGPRIAGF